MSYKVIERPRTGSFGSPAVTVTKDGFYINTHAVKEFNINEYHSVEYHVDEDSNTIGLKLLDKPSLNSVLIPKGDKVSCSLAAGWVVRFYNLGRGIYPLAVNEDTGLIEFTVKVEQSEDAESEAQETHERKRGRPRKAA